MYFIKENFKWLVEVKTFFRVKDDIIFYPNDIYSSASTTFFQIPISLWNKRPCFLRNGD